MSPNPDNPLLSLVNVKLPQHGAVPAIYPITFELFPRSILLVEIPHLPTIEMLGDVIEGMASPAGGRVEFLGICWHDITDARRAELRARIGRIFAHGGWISNLTVFQNVTLATRHHQNATLSQLRTQAGAVAGEIGIDIPPDTSPEATDRRRLCEAACVRALMGNRTLFVLERPEAGLRSEVLSNFAAAIEQRCAKGAATIWMTDANIAPLAGMFSKPMMATIENDKWRWLEKEYE